MVSRLHRVRKSWIKFNIIEIWQLRRPKDKPNNQQLETLIGPKGILEFGIWNLEFGIWNLEFGIWNLKSLKFKIMITYFVQVNVCWLLFYGAYFALLSRETFFRLNRMWLIISLLGGLILPLVAPTFEVVEPTNVAVVMLQPLVVTAVDLGQNLQNTEGSFFKILAAIYGLGLAATLGKLLLGFWKIKQLHQCAERLPMADFTLLKVRESIAPFSFFRWIFINLNLVQSADLQQIIMHERAHVRERHSFDVVFAELLGVVFWWSPLVYFYTKSLKNVHEYAADAAVLRTSSPPQYGRLLLRQQQFEMPLSLTNPFFSQLKKRILMMTRNPSKRRALAKYTLAVPIFLVLTLLLASPKTRVMATTEAATERAVASLERFEKDFNSANSSDTTKFDATNATINQADGMRVSLENGDGETLNLTDKTLKINSLLNSFNKLNVVQTINGVNKPLEVEQFMIVRIRRDQNPIRVMNNSDKFNSEVRQIFETAAQGDWFQIMNIRTVQNAPKIAARTWIIENATPSESDFLFLTQQQQSELAKISESPIACFGGKYRTGMIAAKDLATPNKLEAFQNINGKVTPVEVLSFVLGRFAFTRDENDSKWVTSYNVGAELNAKSKQLLEMAVKHDTYTFTEIKCRIKGAKIPIGADDLSFFVERTPPQYFAKKDSSDPVFTTVDDEPTFVGGQDSMFRFLGRNIKYPAEARDLSVEGTVYIGFIVEKDGSLTNVTIKRNVPESKTRVDTIQQFLPKEGITKTRIVKHQDESCAEEALRVVKLMPKWQAGKLKGKPMRVSFVLPIKFKLD